MKVAFIVTEFPSLSQTFVLNQITGLIDRGHDVDIFANGIADDSKIHEDVRKYNLLDRTCYYREIIPKNKLFRLIKAANYVVRYMLKRPAVVLRSLNIIKYGRKAASFNLFFKTIPFMDKGPYDIIHCHFGPTGNLAVLLKEVGAIRGKVITAFHGYDLSSYIGKNGNRVYEKLFEKGELFLPISRRWKKKLIKLGCPKGKVLVHRMGIDVGRLGFLQRKIWKNGKINILSVARLVEKKGVEYGIQAVAKVLKDYPDLQYSIAGDGSLKRDLVRLINKLDIDENVKLLGWKQQNEISELMSHADILLAPSVTGKGGDQEGIPVVLMEAMARGLPVISTYHSGIPELVQDGISGFLLRERDVDGLAEKLEHLITHPEMRDQMGAEGRKYVEENYNIDKLNNRLVEIYKETWTS
jgi:colanic acid/amylovoran biosynthesis glycosyltransferase